MGKGKAGQELPESFGADWLRTDLLVTIYYSQMQAKTYQTETNVDSDEKA